MDKHRPAIVMTDQQLAPNPYQTMLQALQVIPLSFQPPSVDDVHVVMSGKYEGRTAVVTHVTTAPLSDINLQMHLPKVTAREMQRVDRALDLVINTPTPVTSYPDAGNVFRARDPKVRSLYLVASSAYVNPTLQVQVVPLVPYRQDIDPENRLIHVMQADSKFIALVDQVTSVSTKRFGAMVANFDPETSQTFALIKAGVNHQLGLLPKGSPYPLFDPVM
jgi:mRNA-degrading endonuclease toxin of MazEF toxin-antitoxin module